MIHKQRLNNRILSLVLALVMVLSMLPMTGLTAFAADGDSCETTDCTGAYTNGICSNGCYEPADLVGDVYQIGNAGQLYWFAEQVNGSNRSFNAKLTENIVINEKVLDDDGSLVDDTSALRVWRSIGYFQGVFDGDGHTISGLYTESSHCLFQVIQDGTTVKNVGVINSYTPNAGIVTLNYGTVSGCWVADSLISGFSYTGSIVRQNEGTVENCWSNATVQTTAVYSGGLVGANFGSISNCYNLGTTSATNDSANVGAIVGYNDANGSVNSCYFISDHFSGAVGYNKGSVDAQGAMPNGAAMVYAGGTTTSFTNLQDAFSSDAVKSGTADEPATVTLLSDATASNGFRISYAHIILDLNGFNVNCTYEYGTAISVTYGGGITVRGEGTITGFTALRSTNSVTKAEGGTLEGSYSGISASEGELHISGGTVKGGSSAISYSSLNAFTISGGTFYGKFYDNGAGGSRVQPVITGGSFPEGIFIETDSSYALGDFLGEDCGYYDADGKKVTLAAGQQQITGYVTVKRDISNATVDVTAPEAGEKKQTAVSGGTGYSAAISWNCDTEKFGYNTAYTATVTLTADGNHKFASDLTASGWNVVVNADGTTATLTKTFDTTRKEMLTEISAPKDSKLSQYYTNVADAIKELPTTVVYTTESGSVTVNIEWACSNYDYAVTKTNTFTWKVKDGELTNYDENNIATTGEITVTNASAITVENSGENKTITYSGSTYDVVGMFTIDKNAGEASYAITGGTGAGTLNGSVLTITKAGTFEIKLTTAAGGAYAAGEATATLTVNKGAGSGIVTIEGWTYGEDANAPVVNSSTNGNASVTYLYESTDGKGYNGSVAPENAGSYKLTVTFAETDLYEACTDDATFTIEQKKITASITGSVSKVYDGTNTVPNGHGLSIALSEVGTDDVTATASYAYDGVNVGTTKINATGINLSGADAGNYKLTATTASANVGTITQATPAYTVPTGLTATYGDTLADVTLPEGFAWEATLTTAVGNVGNREFTVTYTPGDTLNYKTVTGIEVSIEVKAAAASVATAPTAISGLIYNKTAQELITAGTANGGELQYSFSKDSGYSAAIPTGTGAGTYTVWYKVVGDSNHSDTAPVSIEVKIGKADPAIGAVTAGVVNDTLDISAIALNRADTTVDGSFTVDAGQELKLGDNEIAYTFTPADTDNYERVTGKVTVTVKDTIAPTGKVTLGTNSWNEFLNDITFGLFFKETQTVSVEASDSFSGVEKMEYYAASDVLDLDGVKALADDKWTVMDGSVNVTAEDAKQFIYYIRITDKSGNIGYLATNGAEFDTTAPVIDGVHNGVTYYTTQKIAVTDKNLDSVTLNGEAVTGTITLDGNKEATYIIVATDKAGNATTVTVTMKLTESVGAPLDGITEDNVTSEDKDTVQDVIDQVEDLLDDEDLTEEEKAALEEIKEEAEKLIEKIEEVTGATDTENTEKVEDITPENVKPEDKTDLEKAKEDLEDALENNGDNYTEDEKKAIQEEIDRIDEALDVIDRVEKVEQQIENLPDTITKDDTDDVDAAKKAYDELSDYEKTLIDPVVKAKLDDAVKAAEDVNKPADTNSPQTGDNTNLWLWIALLFVSGGAVITLTVYDRKRRTVNSK